MLGAGSCLKAPAMGEVRYHVIHKYYNCLSDFVLGMGHNDVLSTWKLIGPTRFSC